METSGTTAAFFKCSYTADKKSKQEPLDMIAIVTDGQVTVPAKGQEIAFLNYYYEGGVKPGFDKLLTTKLGRYKTNIFYISASTHTPETDIAVAFIGSDLFKQLCENLSVTVTSGPQKIEMLNKNTGANISIQQLFESIKTVLEEEEKAQSEFYSKSGKNICEAARTHFATYGSGNKAFVITHSASWPLGPNVFKFSLKLREQSSSSKIAQSFVNAINTIKFWSNPEFLREEINENDLPIVSTPRSLADDAVKEYIRGYFTDRVCEEGDIQKGMKVALKNAVDKAGEFCNDAVIGYGFPKGAAMVNLSVTWP